jgi:tetratricopeptide (TPR) repeat protein
MIAALGCLLSQTRSQLDKAVAIEDPTERIAALKELIKENPAGDVGATAREEIVLSWAQLAARQLADNNIERALEAFRSAIDELPETVTDKFFQETVGRIPFAISARGYRAEAIAIAHRLEARFAKEPLRLGALGEFYLNLEAPGEAIRALEAAVKAAPGEVRLRRPLASAYRMGLRLQDAAKELEQVAALDARDRSAYVDLGNLARARGDYEEATRLYRSQLKIDDKQTAPHKGLALTFVAAGREDQAVEEFGKIREMKGPEDINNDLHLQTQLAFYYLVQDKLEQAAQAAVRGLSIEPRYSWTRLAAAEVALTDGRVFEAEQHLLAALSNADFPTLRFTLGKLYLTVEDFDGALEQFARAFSLTRSGKFATKLGGVLEVEADGISDLLARERQAAIFVAVPPTSEEQFRLAESLVRFDAALSSSASPARTRSTRGSGAQTIEGLAAAFVDAEGRRRAFRALYVAQKLSQAGRALPYVGKLTDQVIDLAEPATEPEGSVRDYPNYDRDGRLRIVRGRALDANGWALFQMKRNREAVTVLTEAVDAYGGLPEGKRAIWHLATVKETVGEEREALDLYVAGYEPPREPAGVDVKRTVIEGLYRKVHGSLDGLNEKIGAPAAGSTVAAATTPPAPPEEVKAPIVELPAVAEPHADLVLRPATAAMKSLRSRSLLVENVPASPASIESPTSVGKPVKLVTLYRRENLRMPIARVSRGLMRWPLTGKSEHAPAPGDIAVAESEKANKRPRVVNSERPRTVAEPEGNTRSRRVVRPNVP